MKLNKNEFKWFLILIGFTYYIYNLLSTGKIYFFLNPRMIKYAYFSFAIFLILSIFQLRRLFISTQNNKRKIYFCIFLAPLFLGIYTNPQGLTSEVASKRGVIVMENNVAQKSSILNTQSKDVKKNDHNLMKSSSVPNSSIGQSTNSKMTSQSQSSNSLNDNTLIIDGKNFTHITDDICYNSPDKYKGKRVTITGFVYRDDSNLKNEFLVARLMMVCCAADTEVTGLSCDWNKASKLKNNEWVKVTGTIDSEAHNINGEKSITPIIKVENIEPSKQPQNQYIYPE